MRHLVFILVLSFLLTGCAAAAPALSIDDIQTTEETTPPATIAADPPDPMQLLLDSMTLEEKVGQLFLARCNESSAVEDIGTFHPGGFILFGRDFDDKTPDSFRSKIMLYLPFLC